MTQRSVFSVVLAAALTLAGCSSGDIDAADAADSAFVDEGDAAALSDGGGGEDSGRVAGEDGGLSDTGEDTPAEDAPAEDTPAEDAAPDDVPVEDAPGEDAPADTSRAGPYLNPQDYDTSCTKDEDCTVVFVGDFCDCDCTTWAVGPAGLARYREDVAGVECDQLCEECFGLDAACTSGHCSVVNPLHPTDYDHSGAPAEGTAAADAFAYCEGLDEDALLQKGYAGTNPEGWYEDRFGPLKLMVQAEVTWAGTTARQWVYPCADSSSEAVGMMAGHSRGGVVAVSEDEERYVLTLSDEEATRYQVLRCDWASFFSKEAWTAALDHSSELGATALAARLAGTPLDAAALEHFVQYGWWHAAYGHSSVLDASPVEERQGLLTKALCFGVMVHGDWGLSDELKVFAMSFTAVPESGYVVVHTERVKSITGNMSEEPLPEQ